MTESQCIHLSLLSICAVDPHNVRPQKLNDWNQMSLIFAIGDIHIEKYIKTCKSLQSQKFSSTD